MRGHHHYQVIMWCSVVEEVVEEVVVYEEISVWWWSDLSILSNVTMIERQIGLLCFYRIVVGSKQWGGEEVGRISRNIIGTRPPPSLPSWLMLIVANTPVSPHSPQYQANYLPDQGQGQLTGQCLHPRRYLACAGWWVVGGGWWVNLQRLGCLAYQCQILVNWWYSRLGLSFITRWQRWREGEGWWWWWPSHPSPWVPLAQVQMIPLLTGQVG